MPGRDVHSPPTTEGRQLTVRLLGPLEVVLGGRLVALTTGRLRTLLAALAMSAGGEVPVERLATAVWGDDPPRNPRRSVQTYLTRLRAVLGAELVETRPDGYLLRVDPDAVDALRFLRLTREVSHAASPSAVERARLGEALALWRGTPFEGVRSGWLEETESARLVERFLVMLERRIDLDLADGGHDDLAGELCELTARYPLRESLWLRRLMVLDRCGRQAEALDLYEKVRAGIAEELGVDPGPELQRMYADLLASTSAEPVARATVDAGPAGPPLIPRQLPADADGFVGRATELAGLDALVDGDTGAARPVVITAVHGAGGAGKTALAVHWAHRVCDRFPDGQLYLDLRGFGPGTPMEPAEALDALLRGLGVRGEDIPGDVGGRGGLLRTTLADRRVLLLLDNARDTEQVRPLLPGTGSSLVVVTSRRQLRGLTAREGATRIAVDQLTPAESTSLLRQRLDRQRVPHQDWALARLAQLCGHLPLALVIAAERVGREPGGDLADLLHQLEVEQHVLDGLQTGDDPLTSVRAVFSWSYQALDADAARMFRLLGLYPGRDLGVAAAAALCGVTAARADHLLDRLVEAHLLRRARLGRYAMHDLLRAYAAEQAVAVDTAAVRAVATSRIRSWYLHSAANANARLSTGRFASLIDPGAPEPDVTPLEFAHDGQALSWFDVERDALLRVVSLAAEAADPTAYRLLDVMWAYLTIRGSPAAVLTLQDQALDVTRVCGDVVAEAAVTGTLGTTWSRLGRFDEGVSCHTRARELFQDAGHLVGECWVLGSLGSTLAHAGRLAEACPALEGAIELARSLGLSGEEARALNNLAPVYLATHRHADAAEAATRAVCIARQVDASRMEAYALDTLASVHLAGSRLEEAEQCLAAALTVHRRFGDRPAEAVVLRNLGLAYRDTGRAQAARSSWEQALQILDEIGAADNAELSRADLHRLLDSLAPPLAVPITSGGDVLPVPF